MTTKSPVAGTDRVEHAAGRIEADWGRDESRSLERRWEAIRRSQDAGTEKEKELLGDLIKEDLRLRFERGLTPSVREYLERFPPLSGWDTRVVSLIYEEYCLREERGDSVDVAEFCEGYPDWRDSLAEQIRYHEVLGKESGLCPPPPRFPEVGSDFEEFRLLSLIGKGGSSRVYLASDLSLGGKRVVLKVSLDRGQEPKIQGALDHPHIVPVNSVAFDPDQGLRGLSMPHRPGLPLDEVIRRISPVNRPTSARPLWDALVQGVAVAGPVARTGEDGPDRVEDRPRGDGWAGFPSEGSYERGVAWIAMVLARALHYAHSNQTFHRDVKPGNILLTLHHGPQLLDFNLAESPHSARRAETAMLGGTLPYMAPEQIRAFLNPGLWPEVGARADVYSLGLVVDELLTGRTPDQPDAKSSVAGAMRELLALRSARVARHLPAPSGISHALDAILTRCLAPDPESRYPDAKALADDLDRFLARRPLIHATNPSRRERLADWLVRNRRQIALNAAYLAVIVVLLAVIANMAAGRVARWRKPPVESLPSFQAAVAALGQKPLDKKAVLRALTALQGFAQEYPWEFAPAFYLSMASARADASGDDVAQRLFSGLVETPEGRAKVVSLGERDPDLIAGLLLDFASNRLEKYQFLVSAGRPHEDAAESRLYKLAAEALRLAVQIAPQFEEAHANLALIEEAQGHYAAAHERLERAIGLMSKRGQPADVESLISWTAQRGRVAVLWAKSLAASGRPADLDRAHELLKRALDELDRSIPITLDRPDNPASAPGFNLNKVHFRLYISLELRLALAELELKMGSLGQAESGFRKADDLFLRLVGLCRNAGLPLERADELSTRIRNGRRATRNAQNRPASR